MCLSFFIIYFVDYAITVVLIFLPLSPSTWLPPISSINLPQFMSMGHAYKFFGYCTSYTVLNIPLFISLKILFMYF